jgi:hypothetical protein
MKKLTLLVSTLLLVAVTCLADAAPALRDASDGATFDSVALSRELIRDYEKIPVIQGCTVFPAKLKFPVISPKFVLGSADGSRLCFGDITSQLTAQKAWKHTPRGYEPIALTSLITSNATNHPVMLSELPNYAEKLKKAVSSSCGASWATEKSKTEPATFIFEKKGALAVPLAIKGHPCFPGVFYPYRELQGFMAPILWDAVKN